MVQFTQNNKIAVAAVSIFLVSFVSMLVFMDSNTPSPDFVKSNVLESTFETKEKGHNVYFSEGKSEATSTHGGESTGALEASYRELAHQDDLPLFVLTPAGKTKFLSANFVEEYGYELKDMKDKTFFSYIDGDDLPEFASAYTDVLDSGKAKSGVGPYRFKTKDGTPSVQVASMLPVIDENGKVSEVIGWVKDITSVLKTFTTEEKVEAEAGK